MVFVLYALIAFPVLADGLFGVTVDGVADAAYFRVYTGEYTTKKTSPGSLYRYQGLGQTEIFQSSAFDDGIKGRVSFSYNGENFGGSMQVRMSTDSSAAREVTYATWINFGPWGDKFGLRLLAGNNSQSGNIPTYSNFDGFLSANVGSLGVLYPVWRRNGNFIFGNNFDTTSNFPYGYDAMGDDFGFVNFYGTNTYDLFMPVGTNVRKQLNLLADFKFEPVTFTVATGGLFQNDTIPTTDIITNSVGDDTTLSLWDNKYDPASIGGMNFALRAEGAKIADLFTIGAVYKHTSSFMNKEKVDDTTMLIDEKKSNHAYGLYFNFTSLDGLGITAGYSGLNLNWSNSKYLESKLPEKDQDREFSKYKKVIFPLYHGIDLRLAYTGLDKFTFSFTNNVSFASVRGLSKSEVDEGLHALGWAYTGLLELESFGGVDARDRSEHYLGVFNALGMRYAVNDNFTAEASVASQFGHFTLEWEGKNNPVGTTHYLGAFVGASCRVFDTSRARGTLRGGLNLRMSSFTHQNASHQNVNANFPTYNAGVIEFGIPLSLAVTY